MYGIAKGGAQRVQPVSTGIGVLNFKFQISRLLSLALRAMPS
jgi:hypothetical protein